MAFLSAASHVCRILVRSFKGVDRKKRCILKVGVGFRVYLLLYF